MEMTILQIGLIIIGGILGFAWGYSDSYLNPLSDGFLTSIVGIIVGFLIYYLGIFILYFFAFIIVISILRFIFAPNITIIKK